MDSKKTSGEYHKEIARAVASQALIESPTLQEAFEKVRESYIKSLIEAPIRDMEGIQKLKMMIGVVDKVKESLATFVNDGKVAEKELSWLEKAKQKLKVL